jgi:hypothetical protein
MWCCQPCASPDVVLIVGCPSVNYVILCFVSNFVMKLLYLCVYTCGINCCVVVLTCWNNCVVFAAAMLIVYLHNYSNKRTTDNKHIRRSTCLAHGWQRHIGENWHNRAITSGGEYSITTEDGRVRPKHVLIEFNNWMCFIDGQENKYLGLGCLHPVACERSGDGSFYPFTQRHYRRLIYYHIILLHVSVVRPSSGRKYINS